MSLEKSTYPSLEKSTYPLIDPSNPKIKKLRDYIKTNFIKPPKDFYKDIIESIDLILESEKILLKQVIKKRIVRDKIATIEQRIEQLKKYNNNKILPDNSLSVELTESIIFFLKEYKKNLSTPNKYENTRSYNYKEAEEDSDDEDLILPLEGTDMNSVKMNLFFNKDVCYKFNPSLPVSSLDKSHSKMQTLRLKINGVLEHNTIITKRKVICTTKTKGVECGNVVYFSDVHLNSSIRCTDSNLIPHDGHIIKKTEKASVEESKIIYVYEGADIGKPFVSLKKENNSSSFSPSEEIMIASLVPLKHSYVTCNAIFVNDIDSSYILVLSVQEEEIKPLDKPILLHSNKSSYFLDDIYMSLQSYLNEYHNISLTNQNRIIGHCIILQLLLNIFYNIRTNALIVGKSGSGKSIWSELLIPLFTLNHKNIMGTDITRNKFIGGRSNMNSNTVNSLFAAGYIATQDMIFAEECTNSLKDFQDSILNQNNNIFHLIKASSGRYVDVAIQGGQKIYPKASTILVGNLEQLDFTQEYKTFVASKYRKLKGEGDREYKEKWPLFKPIEYYVDELKNRELAEAHAIVRQNYKGVSGRHFITRLPTAEMARYAFFIAIEDNLDSSRKLRELKKDSILTNPKREILIEELSKIFINPLTHQPYEVPLSLKKKINDFYNNEFYESRNNYKNIFGSTSFINAHIENNIIMIMEYLVWMNRLYNNSLSLKENNKNLLEDMAKNPLSEDEKILINYFLSFNYNTLSPEEASMSTKPYINDFEALSSKGAINIDLQNKEEFLKKKKEEKEKEDREMRMFLDGNDEGENIL